MLCVLKTTFSMMRFFSSPKTRVKTDDNRNIALKLLNWPNIRAFGYDSLLKLTQKLHFTSKTDALKWPVLKKTIQVTVLSESKYWVVVLCQIFFRDNCFLKYVFLEYKKAIKLSNLLELSS